MSEIILPDYKNIISGARVYDLKESILAASYPMRTDKIDYSAELTDKDIARALKLTEATLGGNSAHNQFATGIVVNFDLTFPNKAWVELERYRFIFFVSSQSTMHRITKFDLPSAFDKHTDPRIIEVLAEKVDVYNKRQAYLKERADEMDSEAKRQYVEAQQMLYLDILHSTPSGLLLTARLSTTYRSLRNVWLQRHDHRLPAWVQFCEWIETLPHADKLLTNF